MIMPLRVLAPEIAHLVDMPLPKEEFLERIRRPLTEEEVTEVAGLFRWFTHRYPTAKDRLDYVRRTIAQWNRILPVIRHG